MAGYANKTNRTAVDRIARSRVTIIYLPARPEGRGAYNVTRILRPTKTPTQKFAWRAFTRIRTRVQRRAAPLDCDGPTRRAG